jgi:hypothetical protein
MEEQTINSRSIMLGMLIAFLFYILWAYLEDINARLWRLEARGNRSPFTETSGDKKENTNGQ